MANTDYHKANVPMLPNVRGARHTKIEIFIYSVVLVAMSLALTPLHVMGLWYFVPAAILGGIFLVGRMAHAHRPDEAARARALQIFAALPRLDVRRDGSGSRDRLTRSVTSAPAKVAGHAFDRSHLPLLLTLATRRVRRAHSIWACLSPALPAIAHGFGVPARDVAWTFTLYLFANVVSIPIMTKLSDSIGRRPIYTLCVSIFAAGSVLAIARSEFRHLSWSRARFKPRVRAESFPSRRPQSPTACRSSGAAPR